MSNYNEIERKNRFPAYDNEGVKLHRRRRNLFANDTVGDPKYCCKLETSKYRS